MPKPNLVIPQDLDFMCYEGREDGAELVAMVMAARPSGRPDVVRLHLDDQPIDVSVREGLEAVAHCINVAAQRLLADAGGPVTAALLFVNLTPDVAARLCDEAGGRELLRFLVTGPGKRWMRTHLEPLYLMDAA